METETTEKVELLPDYEVDKDSLNYDDAVYAAYYPVSRIRATTLQNIGLKVYKNVKDDGDAENYLARKEDGFLFEGEYVVKKEDWQDFIKRDDGKQFVKYWLMTATFIREILCREPISEEDEKFIDFDRANSQETAKCREYLKEFVNQEDKDASFDMVESFHNVQVYGLTLAIEFAYKLCLIESSSERKDADIFCGYLKIVKMQYDYVINEFNKYIQKKEGTK